MSEEKRTAMLELHRDERGNGLLIGPNCPDCQRRETVVYTCTHCDQHWEVPGKYVWSWQGKGHFHEADDEEKRIDEVLAHNKSHEPTRSTIIPLSMKKSR
jgi:hypothetical protein